MATEKERPLEEVEWSEVKDIPVDSITFHPKFIHRQIPPEEAMDLAQSIAANGILDPVKVEKNGQKYRLLNGEQRLRAARKLGLKSIPARWPEGELTDSIRRRVMHGLNQHQNRRTPEQIARVILEEWGPERVIAEARYRDSRSVSTDTQPLWREVKEGLEISSRPSVFRYIALAERIWLTENPPRTRIELDGDTKKYVRRLFAEIEREKRRAAQHEKALGKSRLAVQEREAEILAQLPRGIKGKTRAEKLEAARKAVK